MFIGGLSAYKQNLSDCLSKIFHKDQSLLATIFLLFQIILLLAGLTYRRTVQTKLKASYTSHFRRGLIALIYVLEFKSNNEAHRPVIDALLCRW